MAAYKRKQRKSNPGGKKEIIISDKMREEVTLLAGFGLRLFEISKSTGISERTLSRRFGKDLESGFSTANAKVAKSIFLQATNENKPNVVAGIFWLKTRAGWKETQKIEHGISPEDVTSIVESIVETIRGHLPRRCPGCGTALNLGPKLAGQLLELSKKMQSKKGETIESSD